MNYRDYIRMKWFSEIYDKLTTEEKNMIVRMKLENKNHDEIMNALRNQQAQLTEIRKGQNWAVDFGSDVAANLFTDSLIWLASKLFKRH